MRILVFLLIFPRTLFSQTDIEQIRNDSDVVNFIRAVGHEYFPYTKGSPLRQVMFNLYQRNYMDRDRMNAADARFTDSVLAKRWILADYDGDQLQDLVYYGRIGNSAGIYVFFGGKSRKMLELTDGFARFVPHSIEPYKIGNTNSVIVGTVEQPDWTVSVPKPFAKRFHHDTLIYKFGGFAEYNASEKKGPAFDSIHFRPLSNWVTADNWYLRVYKNGSATYVRGRDSTQKPGEYEYFVEKLTTQLDPREWQDLLDYIDFAQLKDSFELKNVSDQTIAITTAYFTNGTKKTVWDYGMTGTYGLETLYARFYFLAQHASWKVVGRRKGMLHYRDEF